MASPSGAEDTTFPRIDHVKLLVALYTLYAVHKPEFVEQPGKLNSILGKYQGSEEVLFSRLEKKYATRPAFKLPVDTALFVGALVHTYTHAHTYIY